jgi:hypothetical protein
MTSADISPLPRGGDFPIYRPLKNNEQLRPQC